MNHTLFPQETRSYDSECENVCAFWLMLLWYFFLDCESYHTMGEGLSNRLIFNQ